MLFVWTFYSSTVSSTNVFNMWAANQHIRMISEGSCDTEDWKWCWKLLYFWLNKCSIDSFKNILNKNPADPNVLNLVSEYYEKFYT